LLYQLSYLGIEDGRAYRGCLQRLSSRIAGYEDAIEEAGWSSAFYH
jgi:hypothetical protein